MQRLLTAFCLVVGLAPAVQAQTTRSAQSTRQAYGARLDAAALPNNLNARRVNDRIANRLDNRLGLRIERYRVGATADPAAAYRTQRSDNVRTAPVIAPQQQADTD